MASKEDGTSRTAMWIKRTLSRLRGFEVAPFNDSGLDLWLKGFDHQVLGVYRQSPGEVEEMVAFSDHSVGVWRKGKWAVVEYSLIKEVLQVAEKAMATELQLVLTTGDEFNLPIRGQSGRFLDIYEVLHFFDRVLKRPNQ